jgi:hypothetical protein
MGKSRLRYEFVKRAPKLSRQRALDLIAQGDPIHEGSSFGVIGQLPGARQTLPGEPLGLRRRSCERVAASASPTPAA